MKNKTKYLFLMGLATFLTFSIFPLQPASATYTNIKNEFIINGPIVDPEPPLTIDEPSTVPMPRGITSYWEIYSKAKNKNSNSAWTVATSAKKSNASGTLSYSRSFTSSNSYSGTLKVPKTKLDASIGFNVTKSTTATSSFSVKVKKNKSYKIYYRKVYKNYTVKQRRKNINTWTGQTYYTGHTNLKVKRFSHIQFKAVEK